MFYFFEHSEYYKAHVLENLLALKKLHSRGFDVSGADYEELFFSDFIELLLDTSIEMEDAAPAIPPGFENEEEDSEEEYLLSSFKERPQLRITIPIKNFGKFKPGHYRKLIKVLHRAIPDKEELFYYHDAFFLDVGLLESKEGIWIQFVDYHPETNLDDGPVSTYHLLDTMIDFWDKLQGIKEEINIVKVHQPKNNKRRFRILDRRKRAGEKGKRNRTSVASHINRKVAA